MTSYEVFEKLKEEHHVSSYKVAKETNISASNLAQWKSKGYVPKYESLKKIADFFGVNVSVFYGVE